MFTEKSRHLFFYAFWMENAHSNFGLNCMEGSVIISPYKVFSMSKGNPVDPQKGKAADPLAVR